MLISPKNIKQGKILKNRTINFDTVKQMYGNAVLVMTDDREQLYDVLASRLFKPNQMMHAFSPRYVRPLGRAPVRYNIQELYGEIKSKSNGKIKFCKINLNLYQGRNLIYDTVNEYIETQTFAHKLKKSIAYVNLMRSEMDNIIEKHLNELHYEKNYLVFTIDKYITDFRKKVITPSSEDTTPIVLFLKNYRAKNMKAYKDVDLVFFFNAKANALIAINPNDEEMLDKFADVFLKIQRLNNFNNGSDDLADEDTEAESTEEDTEADIKDKIIEAVFNKIAKELKAHNLSDFDPNNKEEMQLRLTIEDKVNAFLANPANMSKSFNELVETIDTDGDIKNQAIRYIESKRVSQNKLINLSKNLDKEIEVVDKVSTIPDAIETLDTYQIDTKIALDKRIESSKLLSMDVEYNNVYARNDLNNAISAFSNSPYLPLAVTNIEYEDTSDDFTSKETVKVTLKTDENQLLSYKLDIPKIIDNHYLYMGGNKWSIAKQMVRLPIVKTKSDRVEITTGYQKMTVSRVGSKVSRRNAYLLKLIKSYNGLAKISYGDNGIINNKFNNDFEYEELSTYISSIVSPDYKVFFNRQTIEAEMDAMDYSEGFLTDDMTPLALDTKDNLIYIKDGTIFKAYHENDIIRTTKVAENMFDFLCAEVLKIPTSKLPTIGKTFVYSEVKFLTVKFPVFVLTGVMNGITDILKRHNIKYKLSKERLEDSADWVEVKFKDVYMYYEDKIKNTMLLNILYMMETKDYNFRDFDTDVPYIDFFVNKMGQHQYVKNTLIINLDKMIDPITYQVLTDLKLPTDIIDLLLLASDMLVNNSYQPLNDLRNYRIRGNEVVAAATYKIIAEAYRDFQNHKLNGRAQNISLNSSDVIKMLMKQPNINTSSSLNPILEIEKAYECSGKGINGINLSRAYTLEMRSYDPTMIGFLSGGSTSFSGSVGIARGMVYSPMINSVRGYVTDVNQDNSSAVNVLSVAEMMSPFTSAQADPPRSAMQVSQTKHSMPVEVSNKQLFGSGVNKTLAYMISDEFCFKAKESGYVMQIDNENKIIILEYDSGKHDAIDMQEVLVKNSNSGFFIKQKFLIVYKEGEHFNKGDVIAYNPSFFKGKGNDIDFCPGTLTKVAITAGDFAFEDATVVTESASKRMASKVTVCRAAALRPNTTVHKMLDVGTDVSANDKLIEFSEEYEDDMTNDLIKSLEAQIGSEELAALSRDNKVSKYSGKIVDIKVFYNRPMEELSESLQNIIRNYAKAIAKKKAKLDEYHIAGSSIKIKPIEQQTTNKIDGHEFDGVLIEFFIEYEDFLGVGDKLTYSTALKGVISKVIPDSESPICEYRNDKEIEAILTPTGIVSRMCLDIYSALYVNKVLIELGQQIKEIWNDER